MEVKMDIEINNMNNYIDGMKKSLEEKSFFFGMINATSFLDYGCADGMLLKYMQSIKPNYNYIGYDIRPIMLERARQNSNITFTDNFDIFNQEKTNKSALILSSIIHEIYSYADPTEFWDEVFNKIDSKYIVIRDMMISDSQLKFSDPLLLDNVESMSGNSLESFESIWGSIISNKNLIHYLLKYKYTDNWDREVKENYLPLTLEQLIAELPNNYRIIYQEHYTPDYLVENIKKDFGFELTEKTHLKIIIERI